jgi:hypothetical protein
MFYCQRLAVSISIATIGCMDVEKSKDDENVASIEVVDAPAEEKKKAALDTASVDKHVSETLAQSPKNNRRHSFKERLKYFLSEKLTKKQIIIGAVIFVVLLGGVVAFALTNRASAPTATQKAAVPKPIITSPLTGLPVSAVDAKRPVTGVMIENSVFARPQSGLKEAGVVFEGIAEAGITRFLALYQEAKPANIGPVRSARPYFVQWALGFDAGYAHVGGSPEALNDINTWHVKNLDQFFNAAYYHRIATREAPHNMYTSMANLNAAEKVHGYTTSKFTGFTRGGGNKPAEKRTAAKIDFSISGPTYSVHYDYNAKSNSYLRSMGGEPHKDATTDKQLAPKVVIALVMPYALEGDGYHSDYNTIGSGHMYVFQNGAITQGTWKKISRTAQFKFLDANDKPIKLNAGQTWVSVVGSKSYVTYKGVPVPKPKAKQ